jgi:nucleotide-binding universal stress UspA family protein
MGGWPLLALARVTGVCAVSGRILAPVSTESVMVEIREILCPTDFSESSRHALDHAIAIAKWYRSRITALHVIHVPLVPEPPPSMLAVGAAGGIAVVTSTMQVCEADVRTWVEPAARVGITTDVFVNEGNAARRILEHAQSWRTDLIVLGTHGLGGVDRAMLGSVTEKVLRKADCPVMTVPPVAATAAKLPYKRLLCPVDFSESSLNALRYALSLAEEADASLTILHVFDWPRDGDLLTQRFDTAEFRRVIEEDARARLDGLVTDDVRQWCTPSTRVAYGKPYREIIDLAAQQQADLIVMGVRGRNSLDLTLFGSTTNQVVRRAPCPVLTLRELSE